MSLITNYAGFSFDPTSTANAQNFLRYLDQAGSPYTIFANETTRWVVQVTTPGLGFMYVGFFPATTFVPGPNSQLSPPAGNVEAILIYNSAGDAIAIFEGLTALDSWVEDFINNPGLLVSGDDDFLGSSSADSLHAGAGFDILVGGGGSDQLFGDAGDDFLQGGLGNDTINGGEGIDEVFYSGGASAGVTVSLLIAGEQNTIGAGLDTLVSIENLSGTTFADHLIGDAGENVLWGAGGGDILEGGAGDDLLVGGAGGVNQLIGGDGIDVLGLGHLTANLYVDLAAGAYSYAGGGWDALTSVEGVIGGTGADTLFGDANGNVLRGWNGNDTLVGRAGDDVLQGEAGDDWIVGDDGNDLLEGGAGVNVLTGGAGIDLASYASQTANLWVDMTAGVYSATGVWDVFFQSVEGVLGGSGNDTIFGNSLDNALRGGAGADALIGGEGADRLEGGLGEDWLVGGDGDDWIMGGINDVDVLTGGAGADTFDLGANAGWDVAFDFNTTQDKFSLGGHTWSGFFTVDADGDGQTDDTLLGYAGGNFVALNVSGLTLDQWNALIVAPAGADDGDVLAAKDEDLLAAISGSDQAIEPAWDHADADPRALAPYVLVIEPEGPSGWNLFG